MDKNYELDIPYTINVNKTLKFKTVDIKKIYLDISEYDLRYLYKKSNSKEEFLNNFKEFIDEKVDNLYKNSDFNDGVISYNNTEYVMDKDFLVNSIDIHFTEDDFCNIKMKNNM